MSGVLKGDYEAAFEAIDVSALVNLGRAQGELYRSLSPAGQQRYRKDFVEGIYAFLFRDLRPAEATFRLTPVQGTLSVLVTGRAGKTLQLGTGETPGGLKIVTIDRR